MRQKGNSLLVLLIFILVLGAAGYFLYSKGYFAKLVPQSQTSSSDVFNYGSTPLTTSSESPQEAGNVSSGAMKLSITSPANGATLNSTAVTITGTTSPNAEVFINDQTTKADAKGNFSLKVTLDEGQNGLVITANDANGDVAEQDISVNVQTF